jgi:hypothetical protein
VKIDAYVHLIPSIEQQLRNLRLDCIVFGMGPTGWLLPWIDQTLLSGIRLWTCHDGSRILPADDVLLMDPPVRGLHPDTKRYDSVVACRPKRLWCINTAYSPPPNRPGKSAQPYWEQHLAASVKGITTVVQFKVWDPQCPPKHMKPVLGNTPPDTVATSVAGATTLAWNQGMRRIGVIGADMMKGHHHLYTYYPTIDAFMRSIAEQATAMGGCIANLSPVTSLRRFKEWTDSASSSVPTNGSETPVPSECSNIASASTLPAK